MNDLMLVLDRIETLETRLEESESLIEELKDRIETLETGLEESESLIEELKDSIETLENDDEFYIEKLSIGKDPVEVYKPTVFDHPIIKEILKNNNYSKFETLKRDCEND